MSMAAESSQPIRSARTPSLVPPAAHDSPLPFEGFEWDGLPQICQALRSDDFLRFLGSEPLRFNRLAHAPCAGATLLRGADAERIRESFARYSAVHGRSGWKGTLADVERAVALVSRERPFHPVVEYLEKLIWDGQPRLDRLAADVLDVDKDAAESAAALVRKWCIAAVARAFEPGCAVDGMLVLLGGGRLTPDIFFRVLVPSGFYLDVPAGQGRKALLPLRQAWVYACHGLGAQAKGAEADALTNLLAATEDEVDGSFSVARERAPRTTVFGSIGEALPEIKLPGLARRVWGVPVGLKLDADKLAGCRDQIWAEAVVEYRKGAPWTLTPTEEEQRAGVLSGLGEPDPWGEVVLSLMKRRKSPQLQEILDEVMEVTLQFDTRPTEGWPMDDQRRLGSVLRSLGYAPVRVCKDSLRKVVWVRDGKPA